MGMKSVYSGSLDTFSTVPQRQQLSVDDRGRESASPQKGVGVREVSLQIASAFSVIQTVLDCYNNMINIASMTATLF